MQPYLFPYIGYFQLMNVADEFVVYDNIKYTKKGWINRNRILVNGQEAYVTFPLKNGSDYLDIKERFLADTISADKKKILNRMTESYRKAPYFKDAFPVIEQAILFEEENLFKYILHSLDLLKEYLEIQTKLIVSSTITIDHTLKAVDKVIAICKALHVNEYVNPSGGIDLYKKENFLIHGIDLKFLKTTEVNYKQYNNTFAPSLSIIDVMMFNSNEQIQYFLNKSYVLQ